MIASEVTDLPQPDLTNQAVGLAAFDRERGAAHRRGAAEAHLELLDIEKRAHVRDPSRRRRAARRPAG